MSAQGLGSRAIIGQFYDRLETTLGAGWALKIGSYFRSDQMSEDYRWLGMAPAMREWVGGRLAKGLRSQNYVILNKPYEATLEVLVDEMRRDKTGQIMVRVNELADRTADHWESLLSTLILNGAATVCYDGQYFFDTDHSEGDSGTQSNSITVTLSTLPIVAGPDKGTPHAPSAEQFRHAIMKAVQQIYGFKDDQGEPINGRARSFLIMVPVAAWDVAASAVSLPNLAMGESNLLPALARSQGLSFEVVPNPRLDSAWGLAGSPEQIEFAVFRADGNVKPFLLQEEKGVVMEAIAEGSEYAFLNKRYLYGVDAMRNVGYGMWNHACKVILA